MRSALFAPCALALIAGCATPEPPPPEPQPDLGATAAEARTVRAVEPPAPEPHVPEGIERAVKLLIPMPFGVGPAFTPLDDPVLMERLLGLREDPDHPVGPEPTSADDLLKARGRTATPAWTEAAEGADRPGDPPEPTPEPDGPEPPPEPEPTVPQD